MNTLKTQNEPYGFYGAISMNYPEHADAAWVEAMNQIEAATGHEAETIRTWLDSRLGRHFANEVENKLGSSPASVAPAIATAIEVYSRYKLTKQHKRDGAPATATYLQADIMTVETRSAAWAI